MFLIQFSSFWLFSGGKHGFVYPQVTWHEYSIVIRSEFYALLPVVRFFLHKEGKQQVLFCQIKVFWHGLTFQFTVK